MNVHVVAGVLLIAVGLAYAVVSVRQVITGTGFWIRQPRVTPSLELARAGGWVGVGVAAIAALLGVNQLAPTAASFTQTATLIVILVGGVCGMVLLRRSRHSG